MREPSIHERVTIVFPGALGDFLLALATLRALRARHAQTACTVVVSAPLRALAALAFPGDETASLDGPDVARLLGGGARPAWLPWGSALYSWLGASDAEVRARLGAGVSAQFFAVERGPDGAHAAVAYARAAGIDADVDDLVAGGRIAAPASAVAEGLPPGAVLVVHPGAGARSKRWDAAGFAALAAWWRDGGDLVVGLAGPAERDEPPPAVARALRDLPLPDVAAVLARAALYVGNDSGISHLAAAVGTPSVVLFGPTDPARWRPLAATAVLRASSSGAGGLDLDALAVERVIAACRAVRTSPRMPATTGSYLDKVGPRY